MKIVKFELSRDFARLEAFLRNRYLENRRADSWLPTVPMVMRRISILTRDSNELSIAAKRFIHFLIENQEELP